MRRSRVDLPLPLGPTRARRAGPRRMRSVAGSRPFADFREAVVDQQFAVTPDGLQEIVPAAQRFGRDGEIAAVLFHDGLDAGLRPEQVDITGWVALANHLSVAN